MIDKLYLTKIGLGMAGVFGVGMIVSSAIGAGSAKVDEVIHTNSTITVPLLGMPFRTTKGEIGSLQRLEIERSAPKMIEAFDLSVDLQEGVSADQFANCEITLTDPENIDEHTSFTCLTAADPGFDDLVRFGSITFSPSGAVHRLMIPRSVRNDIQHRSDAEVMAESAVSDVSSPAEAGDLSIKVNGRNIVDIHGDSSGGRVRITNPVTGETIVDVEGGPPPQ